MWINSVMKALETTLVPSKLFGWATVILVMDLGKGRIYSPVWVVVCIVRMVYEM